MRAVAALGAAVALSAGAQDFMVAGGVARSDEARARSHGWLISYSRDFGEHVSASLAYQNEGHVPSHHRDGHTAQLWARTGEIAPGFELAAGIGPYRYFDTTVAENAHGFVDAGGWGTMYSVAATWRRPSSPWYYQLRFDRVEARQSIDTSLLLLGVGYHLDQDGSFSSGAASNEVRARSHEVALLGGQTIVNSFDSQSSWAKSIEYRHAFGPVLRGSVSWLYEGDARLLRRDGVLAQGWLEPGFHHDRFTLGLGYGAYFSVDDYHPGASRSHVLAVLTTTASYHLDRGWVARVSWHRIVSTYDRDTDIVLLGVGYRF